MILVKMKKKEKELSEREKQVAELALLSGLSNREIAEQLEMTYSGVASTLHRARRKVGARSSRQGYALLAKLVNGKPQS